MAKANFDKLKEKVISAAKTGLVECASQTIVKMKEYTGLTDHSQYDLDVLGNPYHPDRYRNIHPGQPEWLVHQQSGKLYDSIMFRKEGTNNYAIGADESILDAEGKKYVVDVIEGTSRMIARNFPFETLRYMKDGIYQQIMDESIEEGLSQV